MNELDLVGELRGDVPAPTQEQLARLRERLSVAIGSVPAARELRRRRARARLVRRVLVAAPAALILAAVVFALHGANAPAPPATRSEVQVRLAAQVLRAAASSVASQPTSRPAPDQWIYGSFVARTIGQRTQSDEGWTRFDGRQTAYLQDGRLVVHTAPAPAGAVDTPMGAYDELLSLPAGSRALLRAVDSAVAADPGSVAPPGSSPSDHAQTRQQLEFEFLTQLLWQAAQAAPARAEAAAFRALAALTGVTAQRVTDAVGRPAIGLSDTGDEQQLLLDPQTYKVTGLRTLSDGTWPVNVMARGRGRTYPKGTVIESDAWVKIAFVDGPGGR